MKTKKNQVLSMSILIVIAFVAFGAIFPNLLGGAAEWMFSVLTRQFGWLYLIAVFFMMVFAFYVALSPLGKLKMGRDEDQPGKTGGRVQYEYQLSEPDVQPGIAVFSRTICFEKTF